MRQDAAPGDREILDRTGRSFALTIRVLPRALRAPVEIAYLLARAADTIADRDGLPHDDRVRGLAALREELARPDGELSPTLHAPSAMSAPGPDPTGRAEAALLAGLDRLVARFRDLPADDRGDVAEVVDTLVATMERELALFRAGTLVALPDPAALVAYTEGIAGCVGAFWTRLVARHAVRLDARRATALAIEGRRYGRGLQLVNVLRDIPRDLRRGRCFLPASDLAAAGLTPGDLLDPVALPRLAPVLARWEARAHANLRAGFAYTAALPARAWRLRLATVLPARLGVLTLDRIASHPARLDPAQSIRIARSDVRGALAACAFWCLFPDGPRRLARRPAARG